MAGREDHNTTNQQRTADDNELEQYGVWVKAGPEDVVEGEAEDDSFAFADLTDDELPDAHDFTLGTGEVALRIDEPDEADELEDLDIDFDESDLDSDTAEITNALELDDEEEDEDAFAEIGGEDLLGGEDAQPEDTDDLDLSLGEDIDAALEELDLDDDDESDLESLSLDDDDDAMSMNETDASASSSLIADDTEPEEIDFQLDDVLDLSDTAALEEISDEDVSLDTAVDDELLSDLDELDSADDAEEQTGDGGIDIDDDLPDNLDDLTLDLDSLDVDSFEETSGESIATDGDDDDMIDLDMLSEDDTDDSALADLDLTTLPDDDQSDDLAAAQMLSDDSDSDLPELEMDDDVSLSLDAGFDDIGAVEDDMFADSDAIYAEDETFAAAPEHFDAVGGQARAEFTSLLSNIERELASIRQEIRELKSARSAPATPTPLSGDEQDDDEASGFFEDEDDDDDDTIALTGAELDNIMHTAEFTETTGESSDAAEFGIVANDQKTRPGPVQQIVLDDAPDELDSLEISLDGPDDPEDAVDELADLDIDAELADIEELSDATAPDSRDVDERTEPLDDDEPLDAELLDDEPLDLEDEDLDTAPEQSFDDAFADSFPSLVQDDDGVLPENLKGELRSVLSYMDQLLESLPEDKIQEFANSEHFKVYQRLFEELGLEQ